MARRGSDNDKYLRLTGLWQSKKKDNLWTGRLKPEQLEQLINKCEEALKAEAPLVMSLWENEKKSKKDPEFSLQCFVGEPEEEVRSSRSSRSSSRHSSRDREDKEDKEDEEDKEDKDNDENDEEDDEPEKRSTRSSKGKTSSRTSSARKTKEKW